MGKPTSFVLLLKINIFNFKMASAVRWVLLCVKNRRELTRELTRELSVN